MKAASLHDLAYAAGFFDGEGHIRIANHSARTHGRTFMLQVAVVQSTPEVPAWFAEVFGGTAKGRSVNYKTVGDKAIFTWQASSACAARFLVLVLPYLRVKRAEALVALDFRATFRAQYGDRSRMDETTTEKRRNYMLTLQSMRKETRQAACETLQEEGVLV